nr:MAG TPA: hypothetical protein [Caudoviricetes sp.]
MIYQFYFFCHIIFYILIKIIYLLDFIFNLI